MPDSQNETITDKIIITNSSINKIKSGLKNPFIYILVIFIFIVLIWLIYYSNSIIENSYDYIPWHRSLRIASYFLLICFIIITISSGILRYGKLIELKYYLEELTARERVSSEVKTVSNNSETKYFDKLVNINIENLSAYYTLVKQHTNKSFIISSTISIIGFILISIGLGIGFSNILESSTYISYIATGVGVLTEFIATIFFYLYNRTVRQLKEYHDSLLSVQNILLSFKIVEDIKQEEEKNKMISHMLEFLIGSKELKINRKFSDTLKSSAESNFNIS